MEKTLYVSDLDGTLLNRNARINPKSIRIINDLVEKGIAFTYATARSFVSASVATQGLSVDIPVIVYNGASIYHPATGKILSQEAFNGEETSQIISVLSRHHISPVVYSYISGVEKASWITGRENDGIKRYLQSRKGDRRLRPVAEEKELYQGDMFYFTCIGEEQELWPVYDVFSKDSGYRCTFQRELYNSPDFWCEIMPARATKAHAIQKLKDIRHCGRVVSFGDAVNDIPMFELSDECYAVANAVAELKAIATGVIGSNEDDGVANWLWKHAVLKEGSVDCNGGCYGEEISDRS